MQIIEIENLKKEFKCFSFSGVKKVTAVDSLNLTVNKGEIFAFLGPNGAGKTTTMTMLAGYIKPTSGRIKLFAREFTTDSIDTKYRIGYLPESTQLPDYYRVSEFLQFYCDIFFIPFSQRKDLIKRVLHDVGMEKRQKEWIKSLSMGQKRCLGFAVSLINDPEVLFLDEPTVYLDPLVVEKIRKVLLNLKASGKTIFMSSHILSEVEKVSDRFAIIRNGKLLDQGDTQELLKHKSLEEEFLAKIKEDD